MQENLEDSEMEFNQQEKNVSRFYSRISDMNHDYNGGFLTFGIWETESGDPINPPLCYEALYDYVLADSHIDKDHNVLEVACGQGAGMLKIHEQFGCHITGLDVSVGNVEISKRRLNGTGLTVTLGSATKMPYNENTFDIVICVEGMPHFKTREDFFHEAFRVLKPGGKLLMSDCVTLQPAQSVSFHKRLLLKAAMKLWVIELENGSYGLDTYCNKLMTSGFEKTNIKKVGHRVYQQYSRYNLTWSIIREQARIRGPFVGYFGGPLIDFLLKKCYEYDLIDYILVKTEKPKGHK